MQALEADPLKHLVARFNTSKDEKEKDALALELLPYAYPKLKAVDVDLTGTVDINVTIGGTPVSPPVGDCNGD